MSRLLSIQRALRVRVDDGVVHAQNGIGPRCSQFTLLRVRRIRCGRVIDKEASLCSRVARVRGEPRPERSTAQPPGAGGKTSSSAVRFPPPHPHHQSPAWCHPQRTRTFRSRAHVRHADAPIRHRYRARQRARVEVRMQGGKARSAQKKRTTTDNSEFFMCVSSLIFQKTFRRVHPISASSPFRKFVNFRNAFSEIIINTVPHSSTPD